MWGRGHKIHERFQVVVIVRVLVHDHVHLVVHLQRRGLHSQVMALVGGHLFGFGTHKMDIANHSI